MKIVQVIVFGQISSLLNAVAGVSTFSLGSLNFQFPAFQNLIVFIAMLIWYNAKAVYYQKDRQFTYHYFIMGALDGGANYFYTRASFYLTPQAASLLVNCQVFQAMVFARIFLGQKPNTNNIIGSFVSVFGILIYCLFSGPDNLLDFTTSSSLQVIGAVMLIGACALYALNNVLMEKVLQNYIPNDVFIANLSITQTLANLIMYIALEARTPITFQPQIILLWLFVYFISLVFIYVLVPILLNEKGGSVNFNLSLLTQNLYATLLSFALGQMVFTVLNVSIWLLSYVLTCIGILIYFSQQSIVTKIKQKFKRADGYTLV